MVSVVPVEEFSLGDLEPAIAVEIKYVSGLEGSNIMLLKRNDVKVIVDILMGSEMPEEEFELNDLTISAVRSDESDDGSSIHRSLGFSGPAGEYLNPHILHPG